MTFPTLEPTMFPDDVGGTDNVARANCLLNAFRIAVNNSLSVLAMVDGVVDEFEDETGVDTTASTDEIYDASGDYYHNNGTVVTASASGLWSGNTAGCSFSGDDIDLTQTTTAIYVTDAISGDFEYEATIAQGGVDGSGNNLGAFAASAVGSFDGQDEDGGTRNACIPSWLIHGWTSSGDARYGNTDVGNTGNFDIGATFKITRVSGVFKVYKNGSLAFTWAQESSVDVHLFYSGNAVGGVTNVSWTTTQAAPNMVLISETSVAKEIPDEAFLVVWQEDVDSVTPNTDLLAYVTRDADAGTPEWTQVTLVEEATLDTGRILTGSVDISGAASDLDMAWKLVVANNKEQRIHGVGLSWS